MSLKRIWDRIMGRGEYSVTMPIMDGALRPNSLLDTAETLLLAPQIDNLASHAGHLYFTRGKDLLRLTGAGAEPELVESFQAEIAALAINGGGATVIALDDGAVMHRPAAASGEWARIDAGGKPAYVTAMAWGPAGDLWLCVGSSEHPASQWKHDLMKLSASGSLWRLPAGEKAATRVLDGLAFPCGVSFLGNGRPVVSEAWRHRLLVLDEGGRAVPALDGLPGYPGRILQYGEDQHWVCVFAPRSQMIEFVLRERSFREQMVQTIDPRYWMAPTLRAGTDYKEPVQGGGIRHLGIQKPWGPTRSYGLVIKVEGARRVVKSLHSRSDGIRHGITSVAEWGNRIVASSKGDGALIVLPDGGKEV